MKGKAWLLLLAVLASYIQYIECIEAKCSACRAVAVELQKRIDNEGVKNHLDLRHRLDAQGQRYGKVIAYKHSELRAVELLDELCSTSSKYTLGKRKDPSTGKKKKTWMLVAGESTISIDGTVELGGNRQKVYSRQLESYCGGILEEYEDELVEVLKTERFEEDGVPQVLCGEIVKHCKAGELEALEKLVSAREEKPKIDEDLLKEAEKITKGWEDKEQPGENTDALNSAEERAAAAPDAAGDAHSEL